MVAEDGVGEGSIGSDRSDLDSPGSLTQPESMMVEGARRPGKGRSGRS